MFIRQMFIRGLIMRLMIDHMEKCCYPNVHLLTRLEKCCYPNVHLEKCYSNVHLLTRSVGEVLPNAHMSTWQVAPAHQECWRSVGHFPTRQPTCSLCPTSAYFGCMHSKESDPEFIRYKDCLFLIDLT